MTASNIAFLCLVVGTLTLFGGALAWASWMEGRETNRKAITRRPAAPSHSGAPHVIPL